MAQHEGVENVAEYQSDQKRIVIFRYPNGKFYNRYGYNEQSDFADTTVGSFDTFEEAEKTLYFHRPKAEKVLEPTEKAADTEKGAESLAGLLRLARRECEKNPVPKSMFGAALTYAVRQESWLMNVFLDGRLELSNNRAERSVRPFALGRKNWLFSNTSKGADASAAIYSIVETAQANGLKLFEYLSFLLETLPTGCSSQDCLPWMPLVQNLR